ncbi:unnamed protein product [Lymnaea stagnalis]|uniref:Carboxylic ester hydrolase n=1 Tax=Lymnaea stagnalis TaxID=6523 RepID=A0AAV2HLS5_LYMST
MWLPAITVLLIFASSSHGGYYYPKKYRPYAGGSKVVRTTHGLVQGRLERVPTRSGHPVMVDVYWSIPFAKPPVGDLRFKSPLSADPWPGVLDVSESPNSCMQVVSDDPLYVPNPSTPVSEDCLYLTIWRPRCVSSPGGRGSSRYGGRQGGRRRGGDTDLATMVWLYGGGYMTGSTTVSWYNGALLAASQCVIVASMNYRLGAFGFLFLDVPEVPGNMGLLDMTLAARWIKDNIEQFGGDRSRITVFGNSAGGASASLFLLSPLTRNLFTRAIIESGSPIGHLALQSRLSGLETAREFSKSFSCYSTNDSAIARCLMQADPVQLAQDQFELSQDYRYFMTALVDNYFLTGDPFQMLQNGNFKRCELLLGSTTSEGTYFLGLKWPNEYSFSSEQTTNISDEELNSKLNQFFSDFLKAEYIPKIIADVKEVYQLDRLRQEVTDAHLTFLNYVIGDVINTCPVRHVAGFYSNSSRGVFLYSYNHAYDKPVLPTWVGAIHQSEIEFVFGRPSLDNVAFTNREGKLSQAVMTYWANFAKYGTPNDKSCRLPKWPTYRWPDPGNTIEFTPAAKIRASKTEDFRCAYWNNLPRDIRK